MNGAAIAMTMNGAADVPRHDRWLCPDEAQIVGRMRLPKRIADWRLGRWTAKHAVARALGCEPTDDVLASIAIIAAEDGAPEAFVGGRDPGIVISISHRNGTGVCAVGPAGIALGCDIESIEPRSSGFAADYFTEAERARIVDAPPGTRALLTTAIWSAKESALKAKRVGLRQDTRSVEIQLDCDDVHKWHRFVARTPSTETRFVGWWEALDPFVITIASDQPFEPPPLRAAEGEVALMAQTGRS